MVRLLGGGPHTSRVRLCQLSSAARPRGWWVPGGDARCLWSRRSKRDALHLTRLDRAGFTRLRLRDTAVRAAPPARRSPPLVKPTPPSLPRPRRPPASCPAALHRKVAGGSVSPAGETALVLTSRVVRDPQAAIFFPPRLNSFRRPQTPDPEQCACTRQAHPASAGILPHPAPSPQEPRRQGRSPAAAALVAGLGAASERCSGGKVNRLRWESHSERRGAGGGR